MARIGLLSDTHLPRRGRALPAALTAGLAGVDALLHLGDLTDPGVVALGEAIAPFDAVAGNNDGALLRARFGRAKIVTHAGVRIGMVHGDGWGGTTLQRALAAFDHATVDVIAFGHSHTPYCERHGAIWVINPGSPTDKRFSPRYSYAILEVAEGLVTPRLVHFDDRRP